MHLTLLREIISWIIVKLFILWEKFLLEVVWAYFNLNHLGLIWPRVEIWDSMIFFTMSRICPSRKVFKMLMINVIWDTRWLKNVIKNGFHRVQKTSWKHGWLPNDWRFFECHEKLNFMTFTKHHEKGNSWNFTEKGITWCLINIAENEFHEV